MGTRERRSIPANAHAGGRWRCAIRRLGLPLALFAIVVQAAVHFGHHHYDLFGSGSTGLQAAQAPSPSGAADGGQVPTRPAHEPCLVCLAIHASAVPAADAPRGAPCYDNGVPLAQPVHASVLTPLRVAAFDSRAPPLT